jgi:membrane-bound lytic murein transglycosylase B
LQVREQTALAAYQDSLTGLSTAVTSQEQAEEAADQASQAAQSAARAQRQHLQEMYLASGPDLLGITLSDGPIAAAQSSDYLSRLVTQDQRAVASTAILQQQTRRVAVSFDASTDHAVSTIDTVEARYNDVQDLLNEAQNRLEQLSATALQLADVQALIKQLDAEKAAADAARAAAAAQAKAGGIPANYLALYQAAAPTCPGLPWVVLAAIGQVESGHGSNMNTSSAGAQGPMQFLPATFAAFAVDGDKDGITDILDPADAIFTAAHYLCANHAGRGPAGLRGAIYRYNHANWYVQLVLNVATQLAERYGVPAPPPYAPVV